MLLLSRIQKAATASVTADMRMMLLLDVGGKKITVLRGDKIIIIRSDLVNPLFDRAGGLVANRIGNLLQGVVFMTHLQDDPILLGQPCLELVDLDRQHAPQRQRVDRADRRGPVHPPVRRSQ